MDRRSRALAFLIVLSGVSLAWIPNDSASAAEDRGWRLRVDFGFVEPGGDGSSVQVDGVSARVQVDGGAGIGVRGEYQFSPRLGFEIGAFASGNAEVGSGVHIEGISAGLKVSSFAALTAGLNVHLIPSSRPDLYIGPLLAYAAYDDVGLGVSTERGTVYLSADRDVGFGAILGLDVPIGKKGWTFNVNLRHIRTRLEARGSDGRVKMDYDPTIFAVGFGYRF
jgi:outer membrane protein W